MKKFDSSKKLAHNLKKIRQLKNLTLEEISKLSKISVSFLKKIENEQTNNIRISHIDKLCNALNIGIKELFGEN